MSDAPKVGPCCSVGARPDAAEIDAALLGGEPFTSISNRTGINRGSLHRHRSKCLGRPAGAGAGDTETPGAADAQQGETQAQRPATPPHPAEPYATAKRVEDIAGLISLGQWKDRLSVVGLAARWSLPEEEVQRLHRLAAAKCRANRGALSAQAEASVGVIRELRDDALAEAAYHKRQKQQALDRKPPDYEAADAAMRLRSLASKAALDAQKHLDAITLGRGPQKPVQVSVSVTTDAAFASAWNVVRRILDARHPGAAEDCETALACWEDGGDERVAEWLEETAPPAGATTH